MDKKCYTCKHCEEPFGFLEESFRCRITGKYIDPTKCCDKYEHSAQQFFDYEGDNDGQFGD